MAHPFLRTRIVLKHNQSCARREPGLGQEWLEGIVIRESESVPARVTARHQHCSIPTASPS